MSYGNYEISSQLQIFDKLKLRDRLRQTVCPNVYGITHRPSKALLCPLYLHHKRTDNDRSTEVIE